VHWATARPRQRPSSRWTKGQSCTNFQIGPLKWGCSNPTMHKKNFDALQDVMEWKNEFEYLTYIYNKLNSKLVEDIQYMDDRGVAFDFIMRTISTEVFDMWTPSREVLLAAGVLTE
jgi:hypothetical protein